MPSSYPTAYDVFAAHGSLMNEVPLHDVVHVLLEQCIVAIEQENGLNPSGAYATVVARLAAIDAAITSEATSRQGGDTNLAALAAAKATWSSAGPNAGPYNPLHELRIGSVVITLDVNGFGVIAWPQAAFATGTIVPIVCNGDVSTSNGGASVGISAFNASQLVIFMMRADGTAGQGVVRINFIAIGFA